ncbi:MAG: dinitrogenase iron-molybdenum cofactor [bacterium]|nr:dinitrogenase iron-molybdenum cofactor [bacterium]
MKIAIATDGAQVSAHFGRCGAYTIFDVDMEAKEVTGKTLVDTPGHQPGMLPGFLNEMGADIVIAGGMGPRAQNLFKGFNIDPIIGVSGDVDNVILDFVNGTLEGGESLCSQGTDHHHECGHH